VVAVLGKLGLLAAVAALPTRGSERADNVLLVKTAQERPRIVGLHVEVRSALVTVAAVHSTDSTAPLLLFETRIATRFYLPRDDVRMELLVPTDTRTICAYKGHPSYWSVTTNGRTHSDLAWTYEEPFKEVPEIAGYVAFFNERVDVIVDGVRRERPVTHWSRRDDH
jgi:uncharacterized protein (DUF427 family)